LNARSTRKRLPALAFEIQHGIDHVFEDARARDAAFLGDVADEEDGGAGFLRVTHEARSALAHLAHRTGAALIDSVHSVCTESATMTLGRCATALFEDAFDTRFRQCVQAVDRQSEAHRRDLRPAPAIPRP
jgi:hypothetical protein